MKRTLVWGIAIGLLMSGMLLPVWAETSHQVTVDIPEICRYRIDGVFLKQSGQSQVIQEVAMAILSNSKREWRLIAIPEGDSVTVEWSGDGQTWQIFANRGNTILNGNRSPWNSYHFYYRYQHLQPGMVKPLTISYQILFDY